MKTIYKDDHVTNTKTSLISLSKAELAEINTKVTQTIEFFTALLVMVPNPEQYKAKLETLNVVKQTLEDILNADEIVIR